MNIIGTCLLEYLTSFLLVLIYLLFIIPLWMSVVLKRVLFVTCKIWTLIISSSPACLDDWTKLELHKCCCYCMQTWTNNHLMVCWYVLHDHFVSITLALDMHNCMIIIFFSSCDDLWPYLFCVHHDNKHLKTDTWLLNDLIKGKKQVGKD